MDSFEEAQYVYERDSFYYLLNMMRLNLAIEELKDEQKAYQGVRCLFRNAELNYEARENASHYWRKYHRDLNILPTDNDIIFDGQNSTIRYLEALVK